MFMLFRFCSDAEDAEKTALNIEKIVAMFSLGRVLS